MTKKSFIQYREEVWYLIRRVIRQELKEEGFPADVVEDFLATGKFQEGDIPTDICFLGAEAMKLYKRIFFDDNA